MFHPLWNSYLSSIFDWVIETSILASVLVGFIICIKIVLKNWLTPRWKYALWLILIVRLILPWLPESSFSIYSILSKGYESSQFFIQENTSIWHVKENIHEPKPSISTQKITKEIPTGGKNNNWNLSVYNILLLFWILGVLVSVFFMILINRRLYIYVGKQPAIIEKRVLDIFEKCKKDMLIKKDISLSLSGKISSPTLFGIRNPRILLDENHVKYLNDNQLRYIFYHELSHFKRKDISINLLMHCLLILNWFNPILWYAYYAMREDQEIACDNLALTFINPEEKIAYGQTIITLLEQYSTYYRTPTLANFSRNKAILKRRIIMIKKFNKNSYRWSAVGLATVLGLSTLSLVNINAEETSYKKNIVEQPKKEVEQPKKEVEQPKKEVEQPKKEIEQPKKEVEQPKKEVEQPKEI
ncbi:M56 family metallopeptidase [Bacillus toyonensis]|uniref:M56 family metallopeptidase n=2 Tax=Bacillus toyonensis TaxID=155322 RepID=UPI00211D2554|nr:M56 family metallopeptidase [Bacillus toyonensis]